MSMTWKVPHLTYFFRVVASYACNVRGDTFNRYDINFVMSSGFYVSGVASFKHDVTSLRLRGVMSEILQPTYMT